MIRIRSRLHAGSLFGVLVLIAGVLAMAAGAFVGLARPAVSATAARTAPIRVQAPTFIAGQSLRSWCIDGSASDPWETKGMGIDVSRRADCTGGTWREPRIRMR